MGVQANPTYRPQRQNSKPVPPNGATQNFPPLNQPLPVGLVDAAASGSVPAFPAGSLDWLVAFLRQVMSPEDYEKYKSSFESPAEEEVPLAVQLANKTKERGTVMGRIGVSRHPHGASGGAPALQVRSAGVDVSSGFADIDDSSGAGLQRAGCASAGVASCGVGGLRLRRQAHSSFVDLVSDSSLSLTMLTMSIHEVLVARMVSMTCMMHARIKTSPCVPAPRPQVVTLAGMVLEHTVTFRMCTREEGWVCVEEEGVSVTHQHQHTHFAHKQHTQRRTNKRTTHNTEHAKCHRQFCLPKICPRRVIT